MRRSALLAAVLGLALAAGPARAAAEIVLKDGTVLGGIDLELKDGSYLLEVEPGAVVTVPAQLVAEVRLRGDDARAPSGIRVTKAQTLAGPDDPPRTPGYREQLAAFDRPPARFQQGTVESRWRPRQSLGPERDVTNFHPARWYRAPIDPVWEPQSAFDAADDVTHFNPARWYVAPTRTEWRPRDGFAPRVWFPPVVAGEPED